FKIIDYGYDDIENWIDFLIEIETKILTLTGNSNIVESLAIERKVKYNYWKEKFLSVKNNTKSKNKIVHASELYDSDEEIAQKYDNESLSSNSTTTLGDELAIDASSKGNKAYGSYPDP